jgi:hypothetical protein
VTRSFQNPPRSYSNPQLFPSQLFAQPAAPSGPQATSRIAALSIEFVAKPGETLRLQDALPAALHGTLGEVGGFAGGFVLIANYEARLITVVTLWTGAERLRHCNDNLKWIRALLNPYLDRCLRIQTFAAFVPETMAATEFPEHGTNTASSTHNENREAERCAA